MKPLDDVGYIRLRLEEAREQLGGFGEPIWSNALYSLDKLVAEVESLKAELARLKGESDA